jgi:hypothetical protein
VMMMFFMAGVIFEFGFISPSGWATGAKLRHHPRCREVHPLNGSWRW